MPRTTPRFELPELNFLETNAQKIQDNLISRYEKIAERSLAQGDPVRLFLNTIAQEESQLRNAFNLAARSNLLSYASGDYLDALGAYVNTPRLQASKAVTTIRFMLNQAVEGDYYQIPQGTVVTNGNYEFATDAVVIIPQGQSSIDVTATAVISGAESNGIAVGGLNQLADPLPNVVSVENITITQGGSNTESDDVYAERIRLAPASFSVAGPSGAYEYHAKSYSSAIIDACVYGLSNEPGNVYVLPLLTNGELPGETLLDGLYEYLASDSIRPLTDNLIVKAPTAVDYSIELTWFLSSSKISSISSITNQVASAVENYRLWQQSKIGRDLNPDVIIEYLRAVGVKRVEIASPNYRVLEVSEVAQCSSVTINFGGTEDD